MGERGARGSEFWKDVPGYEGRYQASTHGRIRSLMFVNGHTSKVRARPLILSQGIHPRTRYCSVSLCLAGRTTTFLVHRLILATFAGRAPRHRESSHLDGDRQNNYASNLRWMTTAQNARMKELHGTVRRGSTNHCSKLVEADIPKIRRRLDAGDALVALSRDFGVAPKIISRIRDGEAWTHV